MATPQQTYFDFHFHPVFKQFICRYDAVYPSSRDIETLAQPIEFKNPITSLLDEEFLHSLQSQACLEQVREGRVTVGVANIAPVERMFAAKEGLFGSLLNSTFFTSPVDQTLFDNVRDGQVSYYQLFLRELNQYKRLHDARMLTILTRKTVSEPVKPDGGSRVVLAMEGGHSLCRTKIGRPGQADAMNVDSDRADALSTDFARNPVLSPAQSLEHLQAAMWKEQMDLFSMVLTHLSHIPEQLLATHAYGMKMLKDEARFPLGSGLTNAGKRLIDKAYTLTVDGDDASVLIDIKHMSLKSRLDFYAYRKEKNYTQPIIASHMGVTGFSVDEWKGALDNASVVRLSGNNTPVIKLTTNRRTAGEWGAINKAFTYNAWTINMMDEDIEAVLTSGGLIGISLDVRILGWQDLISKGDKEEYMSVEEFRYFFPTMFGSLKVDTVETAESFLVPTREERHPLSLCFNILHIVSVGHIQTTIDPWKQIAIGSDFDGLINPLINCRDSSAVGNLENLLFRWLPVAEERYRRENGGGALLERTAQGDAKPANLRRIIRDILYENGKRFITNW